MTLVCIQDIAKCVMAGIGLFIGCIITGVESSIASDDLDDHCDSFVNNTDNNEACERLEKIYRLVLAMTVSNIMSNLFKHKLY